MISTTIMIELGRVQGNKMVNMQLSNQKLIDRGTRMIIEELHLDYEKAGGTSVATRVRVKSAIEAYRRQTLLSKSKMQCSTTGGL